MASSRPGKAFSKSPIPSKATVENPTQLLGYLNALIRVVDTNITQATQLTNETFIVSPAADVRTSIAGNTISTTKVRDFLLTFLQAVKSNGGVN